MNSPSLLIVSVRFVVSYIISTTIPAAAVVERNAEDSVALYTCCQNVLKII
jgi:hypothetical protein